MSEQTNGTRKWPVFLLIAFLAAESLFMLGIAGLLIVELFTQPSLSVASSAALIVLALIGTALLAATALGVHRGQPWARSLALVWQVLQAAVSVVILQGDMADALGWALAIVALVVLLLVFHPAVTEQLKRR